MRFDVEGLAPGNAYKLLTGTVVPRPIGWVSTVNADGVVNLAPYSFFNAMGGTPPIVALGLLRAPDRAFKDTARNILDSGEFVVNLVPQALVAQMSASSAALPRDESELAAVGLTAEASTHVAPPRVGESPVSFECRVQQVVETGMEQLLVVGEVLAFHIADAFVLDAERAWVDTPALDLIARMHGAGWYARTSDLFQLDRPKTGSGV